MVEDLVAILPVFAPLVVANVGFLTLLYQVWKEQKLATRNQHEIKKEVKNSHTVNLREDLDDKHNEVMRRLDHIASELLADRKWSQSQISHIWGRLNNVERKTNK